MLGAREIKHWCGWERVASGASRTSTENAGTAPAAKTGTQEG